MIHLTFVICFLLPVIFFGTAERFFTYDIFADWNWDWVLGSGLLGGIMSNVSCFIWMLDVM